MSERDNPFGSEPPDNPFGSQPSENPFGAPPGGDRPSGDRFSAPSTGDPAAMPEPHAAWRESTVPHDPFADPPPAPRSNAEGAIPALVLGIVGIVFCPLCAPFAWYLGRKAEGLVDASGGTLSGRGEATAGKILGIIACALMVLGIIALIALIAIGSGIEAGSDSGGGGGDLRVD